VLYAGEPVANKLSRLREKVQYQAAEDGLTHVSGLLLTALDDIAWLLNLRGSDIDYNPVFFAYAFVPLDPSRKILLYASDKTLRPTIKLDASTADVVEVREYSAISTDLADPHGPTSLDGHGPGTSHVYVDLRCNSALASIIGEKRYTAIPTGPVVVLKSIKNPTQLEGFRQCHMRDAAALCEFFAWLEDAVCANGKQVTEVTASDYLRDCRAKQPHYVSESFATISSAGPNGAVIHYKPEPETCRDILPGDVYLCDSGGQYLDGTTDVTRTIYMATQNTPTAPQMVRDAYTRVLQGHISLASVIFPVGCNGSRLDPFSRRALWEAGLDCAHDVGHGVGHYLNVHEGPHAISRRMRGVGHPLEPGMTVTDEPGYYLDGSFGIRIESILLVASSRFQKFLEFENITFVPFDRRLIDTSLLSPVDISWIDSYHKLCRAKIAPLLQKSELATKWLLSHTEPLSIKAKQL
jgi:Xaa-Pro aminopeptidase